jgi:hypothetical protein
MRRLWIRTISAKVKPLRVARHGLHCSLTISLTIKVDAVEIASTDVNRWLEEL